MKKALFFCLLSLSLLLYGQEQEKIYLFSFFKGNGQDGLHLAYSRDGLNFTALNNDKSFLTPLVGVSKLMRDPCRIRTPDGTFHMVWTAGWTERGIGYSSSKDLINWSEQKYFRVMEKEPAALNYRAEGPSSIKIGKTRYAYFDKYTEKKMGAVISNDLKTRDDISDRVTFPEGVRHGTVFEGDKEILSGLLNLSRIAVDNPAAKSETDHIPGYYNVRDFGAKGDSLTLDTDAINKAIDEAASKGGGTVYFPAGNYLSFSIHLKSNITLHLDNGAVLVAADPSKGEGGFDPPEPNAFDLFQDFGHSHWHNSLIWGENLKNIAITGHGRIVGNGLTRSGRTTPGLGNKAIALKLCRNVILKDFTILRGGHFCLLATGVDNMTIDNVKLDTNRDGFDIDCCRHVRMSNCSVNSPFDDAIVLKSSYGLGFPRVTEDVTITNCSVSGFDIGTFLDGTYRKKEYDRVPDRGVVTGRIKFGTESNGGFRNITISNCTFEFCRGLAIETVDGGILEDIIVTNVTMRDVMGAPFFLRLGARMRGPEGIPVGKLRRVTISNVIVYSANPDYTSLLLGIPGYDIEDIKLSNLTILVKGGAPKEQAEITVPELEKIYPDPQEFGKIPAYGFFIRHAKNVEMVNVELKLENEDFRPPFILEDVKGASFINVKAAHSEGIPSFILKNVSGFKTVNYGTLPDKKITKTTSTKF